MYQSTLTGDEFNDLFDITEVDPLLKKMCESPEYLLGLTSTWPSNFRTRTDKEFDEIKVDHEVWKLLENGQQFDYSINQNEPMDCTFFNDILAPGECLGQPVENYGQSLKPNLSVGGQTLIYEPSSSLQQPLSPGWLFGCSEVSYSAPTTYIAPPSPADDDTIDMNKWYITDETGKRRRPLLYEFLRLLLANPRYSDVVGYVDKELGIFRFYNRERAAELWGLVKGRNGSSSKISFAFAKQILIVVSFRNDLRKIRAWHPNVLPQQSHQPYSGSIHISF